MGTTTQLEALHTSVCTRYTRVRLSSGVGWLLGTLNLSVQLLVALFNQYEKD